ncbi:MAG TPA: hypothetical protein VM238_03670 [Phycisphaerae bacterium]|nr:hypothetical protein [Phycisphaerae bacterium]
MQQPNEHRPDVVPFGSNAVRLSPRQWLVALAIIAAVLIGLPHAWEAVERANIDADYRLPYRLSDDYWTFSRWARAAAVESGRPRTLVVGDSVVWGHYVSPSETLSGHLNACETDALVSYANLGVDGIHPAALAGLLEYYGRAVAGRDVILHSNLLWLSSKRHDLSTRKEFAFNHPWLVPQFVPRIPCYRESADARLAIAVGRHLGFLAWADHVRIAYFDSKDLASWSLEHPYDCPVDAVTLTLPSPDEPPTPLPDARPWTAKGIQTFGPAWVPLDESFQWASFRAAVEVLRRRGCRVFVLVGPFNEHMLEDESLRTYKRMTAEVAAWLEAEGIPYFVPAALPSDLYADASHPLSEGYRLLAKRLLEDKAFRTFMRASPGRNSKESRVTEPRGTEPRPAGWHGHPEG